MKKVENTFTDFVTAHAVHAAGTNGKGSTCAYIAAGLIQAGYKTGLFTSPHVLDITERITVNNVPIPFEKIPELPPDRWFQTLWETALLYFAEQNVDYAVIETGIGGLFDCTNQLGLPDYDNQLFIETARGQRLDINKTILPKVSVITKIGYDHMDLLGNTIEEIAAHKAGIIKPGIPVVTDPTQLPQAMDVIRETAALKNSPLIIPPADGSKGIDCNKIIAAETLRILGVNQYDFSGVKLPGRLQIVSENPLIIADGSHNADSIKAALDFIEEYNCKKIIVFGMIPTKDYNACIKLLEDYQVIPVQDVSCPAEFKAAIKKAAGLCGQDGLILICGSMYLAGTALRYFGELS